MFVIHFQLQDSGNNRIRRVFISSQSITTVAGNGTLGSNGDGLPATRATLNNPQGVWLDTIGNLFIAERNYFIRKVSVYGIISTIAGTRTNSYNVGDVVLATHARLGNLNTILGDSNGNIYFVDSTYGYVKVIQNNSTATVVRTVIGNQNTDVQAGNQVATLTGISGITSLWVDAQGVIYTAESGNNWVRKTFQVSYPSGQPTSSPSSQPSLQPFSLPTTQPSSQPTKQPISRPTGQPSSQPSRQPFSLPTSQPTTQPSSQPTVQPISRPTGQPSSQPSSQPTRQPLASPTNQPSSRPSSQPTMQPNNSPSSQPTKSPSSLPSVQPSNHPSSRLSSQPISKPTSQPSMHPTVLPISSPSSQPKLSAFFNSLTPAFLQSNCTPIKSTVINTFSSIFIKTN